MVNKLIFGLEVMVIGCIVVAITLFLLYLIFDGFGILFAAVSSKKVAKKEQEHQSKIESEKVIIPKGRDEAGQDNEISPEILAVITGALAVYAERPGYRLIVRRVKREKSPGFWIMAGGNDVTNIYRRESIL